MNSSLAISLGYIALYFLLSAFGLSMSGVWIFVFYTPPAWLVLPACLIAHVLFSIRGSKPYYFLLFGAPFAITLIIFMLGWTGSLGGETGLSPLFFLAFGSLFPFAVVQSIFSIRGSGSSEKRSKV